MGRVILTVPMKSQDTAIVRRAALRGSCRRLIVLVGSDVRIAYLRFASDFMAAAKSGKSHKSFPGQFRIPRGAAKCTID